MTRGEERETALAVKMGETAPDFDLPAVVAGVKERFRLSDRRGKQNVLLAFYPRNWEEVSDRQMRGYQTAREQLLAQETEVVCICVDSIMNTTAWEREIGPFDFALCSDFWPHGEVSARYGILQQEPPFTGVSGRAVCLVDKEGRVAFRKVYASEVEPPIEEILEELKRIALQTSGSTERNDSGAR